MEQKEKDLRSELADLETRLADQSIYSDSSYPKLAKRRSELADILALYDEKKRILKSLQEAEILKDNPDKDIQSMALEEIDELTPQLQTIDNKIIDATVPKDPNDERDVIIEIRAAAGGDGRKRRARC